MIYELLGQNATEPIWDGRSITLQQNENANMPQTAAGTMILAYFNMATQNNQGTITVTSGGSVPVSRQAPALDNQPSVWLYNWRADNLSVTNTSAATETPIWLAASGPGTPGQVPLNLPIGGNGIPLATMQSAQVNASPQYMQLVIRSNAATLGILGIIGGPLDSTGNNAYVIAVNHPENTGPGTGKPPPEGYYATTTSNSYTYQFNWGSSLVFVVNMSPATASSVTVVLRKL